MGLNGDIMGKYTWINGDLVPIDMAEREVFEADKKTESIILGDPTNKEVISRYSSLNPSSYTVTSGDPNIITELFDLYFSLGPTRTIERLYEIYEEKCEDRGLEPEYDFNTVVRFSRDYMWDPKCREKIELMRYDADRVAGNNLATEREALKRRQIHRITKMNELAEKVIDVIISRVPDLQGADLKTLSTYFGQIQSMVKFTHQEERDIMDRNEMDTLTKNDLLDMIPAEFHAIMEQEAQKMIKQ